MQREVAPILPQRALQLTQVQTGGRNRRRRRRRVQNPSGTAPVQGTSAEGQFDADPKVATAVERIKTKMSRGADMSSEGKMMVMAMCNPNGEVGRQSQARITDVASPQSVSMCPRAFTTIVPPFSSQAGIADTAITRNWSFLGWSPPAFKTIAIMVACKNAATPSRTQEIAIWDRFNLGCATYPLWTPVDTASVDTANYLVCRLEHDTVEYRFLSGLSTDIQQIRFVGDGILIGEQTSTWLDQGSLVTAQFPTDVAYETRSTSSFTVDGTFSIGSQSSGAVSGLHYPISCELNVVYPDGAKVQLINGVVLSTAAVAGFSAALFTTPVVYRLYDPTGTQVGATSTTAQTPVAFFYELTPVTNVPRLRINMGSVVTPGAILSRWITLGSGTNVVVEAEDIFSVASNEVFDETVTVWIPPRIAQLSMAVADPKYDGESVKVHHGFYAVRRPEAPVFNYTDTATGSKIIVKVPGATQRTSIYQAGGFGGDLIDKNFLTICWNVTGISWAHLPIVKNNRFLEFVPMPDSSYAQFCYTVPALDDYALIAVRQVSEEGPHAYHPDMNFTGGLFSFLTAALGMVPRFLRGTASVSLAIAEAVEYAEGMFSAKSWFKSRDGKDV